MDADEARRWSDHDRRWARGVTEEWCVATGEVGRRGGFELKPEVWPKPER
eukprot:COSAG02_NODE_31538_length_531_cov_7.886574_1_plen_50_part_00